MTTIGYGRVSTDEQTLKPQMLALKASGCDKIFWEKASGGDRTRPELAKCLACLQTGDTLKVWKLDRLARSLLHLIEIIEDLKTRGVAFEAVADKMAFDISTPTGKLMFQLLGAFGEFERGLIKERTMAGLAAARAEGRIGGRRRILTDRDVAEARRMLSRKRDKPSRGAVAKHFKVSESTLRNELNGGA